MPDLLLDCFQNSSDLIPLQFLNQTTTNIYNTNTNQSLPTYIVIHSSSEAAPSPLVWLLFPDTLLSNRNAYEIKINK